MRNEIILSRMQGQSEEAKSRAIQHIDRLDFADRADFMGWVAEITGTEPEKGASSNLTDRELDDIAGEIIPSFKKQGNYVPGPGEHRNPK
ncbi:hypothetical protein [Mucilaginibacter sp. UYCu711]|uniref:hypothetical protein n=1 Tax=Mucilaginibacter sp. UYCu711 TaxID=3156339 RepID=UPI003D25A458